MWYDKHHPNTLYIDIRKEEKGFIPAIPNFEINPDEIADFRLLPVHIKSKRFKLIVWDIPHRKDKVPHGILLKKFGILNPQTWKADITTGFKELWSVLDDYGVLLLKFSNYHVKFDELLLQIPEHPLFYNKTSHKGTTETRWFCFMKIPEEQSKI